MHSLLIGKKSTNTNTPKHSVQRQFLSVFSIDCAFSLCQLGVLASYRTVSHLINISDMFLHGVFLTHNTGVNQDSTRFVGKLCANINRCCHSLTVAAANNDKRYSFVASNTNSQNASTFQPQLLFCSRKIWRQLCLAEINFSFAAI